MTDASGADPGMYLGCPLTVMRFSKRVGLLLTVSVQRPFLHVRHLYMDAFVYRVASLCYFSAERRAQLYRRILVSLKPSFWRTWRVPFRDPNPHAVPR